MHYSEEQMALVITKAFSLYLISKGESFTAGALMDYLIHLELLDSEDRGEAVELMVAGDNGILLIHPSVMQILAFVNG